MNLNLRKLSMLFTALRLRGEAEMRSPLAGSGSGNSSAGAA